MIDGLLTVLAVGAALYPVLHGPLWTVPAALLASVPVFWHRRAPVRLGILVGVATIVLAVAHVPPLVPLGGLVFLYTIAADGEPLARWLGVAGAGIGVAISVVVPGEDFTVAQYLGAAYVAAYALGIGVRARRLQTEATAERERRLKQAEAAAVDRERTRIARDLHDIVTHSLGIMVVQAEAGGLAVRADPPRAEETFATIADTGRSAIAQLRRSLGVLRSGADRQPPPGIAAIGDLVAGVHGVEATLAVAGESRPVPGDVDVAAYRIVQEALTNVVRHAPGSRVEVSLRWSVDQLSVEITDNGAKAGPTTPGFGLVGMRERVLACGGTLRAGPRADGFAVAATLPIG
nr:sensor histidine kinase [Fodinicola acaciae]